MPRERRLRAVPLLSLSRVRGTCQNARVTRLRELLSFAVVLPRGPCAACGAHRASPLCAVCLASSAIPPCPVATTLGPHALHFVGAYHARPPNSPHALSPLGAALRAFKDRGDRYAGRCLATLFAARCASLVEARHVVVPVPSDPGRLRDRGLSPAAWLARSLSGRSGARLCTTALHRLPGRPPQRGLGGVARRTNARGAFALGPCNVEGYSVILADDVVTTGATLDDAARCLREAGAAEIVCVVLACADEGMLRTCRTMTGSTGTSDIATRPG